MCIVCSLPVVFAVAIHSKTNDIKKTQNFITFVLSYVWYWEKNRLSESHSEFQTFSIPLSFHFSRLRKKHSSVQHLYYVGTYYCCGDISSWSLHLLLLLLLLLLLFKRELSLMCGYLIVGEIKDFNFQINDRDCFRQSSFLIKTKKWLQT